MNDQLAKLRIGKRGLNGFRISDDHCLQLYWMEVCICRLDHRFSGDVVDVLPIGVVVVGRQVVYDQCRKRRCNSCSALVPNREDSLEIVTSERQFFVGNPLTSDAIDLQKYFRECRCGDFALDGSGYDEWTRSPPPIVVR